MSQPTVNSSSSNQSFLNKQSATSLVPFCNTNSDIAYKFAHNLLITQIKSRPDQNAELSHKELLDQWAKAVRIKSRWESGKVRADEIPPNLVTEMFALHSQLGLSFAKIGERYGISRYLVWKSLQSLLLNKSVSVSF